MSVKQRIIKYFYLYHGLKFTAHLKRFYFLFSLLLTSLGAIAQLPVPNFTANQTSGCAPLVVDFTNLTPGPLLSYSWDLGNGGPIITNVPNPTAVYTIPGTYTVKLTATNATGTDSMVRVNYITVLPTPVVNFTSDKTAGCFPLVGNFTDLSTISAGTITSWLWDFGDGKQDTLQNPQHIYRLDNNYNVTLSVISSNGCAGSLTKTGYVNVAIGVVPIFFNSFANSCKPPASIDFFNNSTGPGTLSYQWRFGDGSAVSTALSPTHLYNAVGNYSVTLIASSSDGCTDSLSKNVDIADANISSIINAPDTGCVNQSINFLNASAPPPDSSGWSYGDGTSTSGFNTVKVYTVPGAYSVKLTNLFSVCLDTVIKRIVILDTPRVDFSSNDTVNCRAPFTSNFTDRSTGAISWSWDFGDGSPPSTLQNPSHTYASVGNYTVKLTATNRNGCQNTRSKTNFIKIAPPTILFLNLPDSGCAPLTIQPIALVNAPDGVASYFWNFGDGVTDSRANPTHVYNTPGSFTISLAVITNGGCLTTFSIPQGIKVGTSAVADFDASPLNVCGGEVVNFRNLSTGTITGYRWNFGDSGSSTLKDPTYKYADTGRFTVTLNAYNNGCASTAVKPLYINVYGTVARFNYTVNCTNKLQVAFRDSSINATTLTWDFGDGSPLINNVLNPIHSFPSFGNYNVTLTTTQGACTYVKTTQIRLINELAVYSFAPAVLCRGARVTLSSSNIDSNVRRYEWDYGDGIFQVGSKVVSNVYDTPRLYVTRLAITDINGCVDITTRNISIGGPRAIFTAINPTGCVGLTVNFSDSSKSDGVNNIISRIWDFGDGAVQAINNPPVNHQYNTSGFFNVKLKVTDAVGCVDSMVQNSLVVASRPRAQFVVPADTISCPGKLVQFLTNSTGAIVSHFWEFGDGGVSNSRNPQHSYLNVGSYSVKLTVSDRYGCSDSITKINRIIIDTPHASFTVSDSVGLCPPLQVVFNYTGSFAKSVRWYFGDGDVSDTIAPRHLYGAAGTYMAILVVTSPGGCTDTAYQQIRVFGPSGTINFAPPGGCIPTTAILNLNSTNTDVIRWLFGDGDATPLTPRTKDTVVSHTYIQNGDFLPQAILTDTTTNCSVVIDAATRIKVIGFKMGFVTNKVLLCDRGTVSFADTTNTVGTISSWIWDFGDGTTGAGQFPNHFYSAPGIYSIKLTVVSQFGCTDSITVPDVIRVVASPVTDIVSNDTLCQNRFITFTGIETVPDSSVLRWNWNFANGDTSSLQNPLPVQYRIPGVYSVRLITTNSSGCMDTTIKTITTNPLPNINAGPDSTICLGQSIQLNATGANIYQWISSTSTLSCVNCNNPVATPTVTTKYVVTGFTALGCQRDDSVTITVIQPSTVIAPPDDSLCVGQGIQLLATGTQVYSWTPATGLNNTNTSGPIARPVSSITYIVTGSDSRGCFVTSDSVRISVFPVPLVSAGPDITIPGGSSVPLNANPSGDVVSISWTPVAGLSCTTCANPIATPKKTTEYSIRVINNGGCVNIDQITIFVTCNKENIFVPNTFSPNGDGNNEVFYPRGRGIATVKSFSVFSRWGQLIFQRQNFMINDTNAGWDGIFRGQKLPPDVYVYIMEVYCENGALISLKGDVMLVR